MLQSKDRNNVGKNVKLVPTFVFLIISLVCAKATPKDKFPDFAFPQTVKENCDSLLNVSLQRGDDLMALRNVMNLCIARNLLTDSESIGPNIALLDSVISRFKPEFKSLAYLIEAQIFNQEYSDKQIVYDQRNLPLEEDFPEDPTEWSGEMFKIRILDLVNKADREIENQPEKSIETISMLLSDWETGKKIGMTVKEFVRLRSVKLLKNFVKDTDASQIPFFPIQSVKTIEGQCKIAAERLINNLISDADSNSVIEGIAMREYSTIIASENRRKYLQECLKKLQFKEGEGVILYQLCNEYGLDPNDYYKEAKEWLSNFPNGFYAPQIKYSLSLKEQKKIELSLPRTVLTDETVKGEATVTNSEKAFLMLYRLENGQFDDYDNLILKKFTGSQKPLQTIEINGVGEVPFSYDKEFNFESLTPGVYVVIPSLTKTLAKGWNKASSNANYATFRVSDIAIITSNDGNLKDSGRVYVVNGKNQEPVEGAIVRYYSGDYKKAKGSGISQKDGSVKVPDGYYRLVATSGKNVVKSEAGFNYYPNYDRKILNTSILTDLAIYRPGDTVRYAVIGWQRDISSKKIIKNTPVIVALRDVNYTIVDSDTLTLDADGRAHGSFEIPKGRLLGSYTLTANIGDKSGYGVGSASISVEEYKLPGFLVTLEQTTASDSTFLIFKGTALTYSGMPVSDGNVNIKVNFSNWSWRGFSNNANYFTETKTDENGVFSLELPTSGLKGTIFEKGRYTMTAEVTSPVGETVKSLPLNFYLGKGETISPSIAGKLQVVSDTVKLNIPVYDMAGLPIIRNVDYVITDLNDSTQVLRGKFISPTLNIPSASLPSGKYKFSFRLDNYISSEVEAVVWRASDMQTPYPTSLWIPKDQYVYTTNQKQIEIVFGGHADEWILYVESDGVNELKRDWLKIEKGMTTLPIDIPEGNPTIFVNLSGMWKLEGQNGVIKIVPERSLEKMEISTKSFRDKLTSGDKENWKFNFKIKDRKLTDVSAFAVMSDKALNAIKDFKWSLDFYSPGVYNKINLRTSDSGSGFTYKNFSSADKYPGVVNWMPEWETYGYPLVSFGGMRINGPIYLRSMKNAKMAYAADSATTEETVEEVEMEAPMAAQTTGSVDEIEKEEVEIRPVEMPLAFFKPDLKANEQGEVNIDFTVPNFNTTWQFQLAGYDENLHSASLILDAVASKPIMVKSNLPQYLRTGDKAQVSAVLYNNSEENLNIEGELEVSNPFTGEIIKQKIFASEEIVPSGNRVITISFEVPNNCNILALKAIGMAGNYSDGERGYIAVLPSSTPVIDAMTFYASSKEENIEIKLPKFPKGANVTLKYCDNPLWEVLLSLPGMRDGVNSSSLSIVRWLYGTLISADIINNNTNIREGIRNILTSKDSTLSESNLAKDQNLKLMNLEATPWVNNASNETERIRSLSQYFDNSLIDAQIDLKIRDLRKLQMNDGGWTWFEGMKSSPYITSEIVAILGYLNSVGLLNAELKEMAGKAVGYYDNWLIENRKKTGNLNVIPVMDYLYTRSLLGYKAEKSLKAIETECADSIVSQWRYWDIGNKAKAGLFLSKTGKYSDEVDIIVKSLKQFLGKRTPISQEALMLELFSQTDCDSAAIDKVRENMLLQKETQDWGTDLMTAGVIQSLILTSPKEIKQNGDLLIYIDGEEIKLPDSQRLTGNFTFNLDGKKFSGKKLTIKREKGWPAWGGIISQYIEPIKDVKTVRVENLSIEKHIYKEDGNGKVKEVKDFNEGDKLTIVIIIDCRKDMDYVAIVDSRAACLKPDAKTSGMIWLDGVAAYQEIGKDKTSFFIENLPAGKYVFSYECHADRAGEYASGIASVQCLYAPSQVAHSAGKEFKVNK